MKLSHSLAIAALLAAPAAVQAQRTPKYEFGVDAAIQYYSQGDTEIGGDLEIDGSSGFRIATPIDVRIGILQPGAFNFEPRFAVGEARLQVLLRSGHGLGDLLFGERALKPFDDRSQDPPLSAAAGARLRGLLLDLR
jgi:hypothetical protein